jgi:hypothetical protein
MRTGPPDVPVREETLAMATIELLNCSFQNKALGIEFFEDILHDFGLDRGGSTAEFIKTDGKPLVNIRVDGVITVAEFLGTYPFLDRPILRGSAVFIGTTYIEGIVPPEPAEPGKGIGRQDLNKIPQVGHIINIGERGGN